MSNWIISDSLRIRQGSFPLMSPGYSHSASQLSFVGRFAELNAPHQETVDLTIPYTLF